MKSGTCSKTPGGCRGVNAKEKPSFSGFWFSGIERGKLDGGSSFFHEFVTAAVAGDQFAGAVGENNFDFDFLVSPDAAVRPHGHFQRVGGKGETLPGIEPGGFNPAGTAAGVVGEHADIAVVLHFVGSFGSGWFVLGAEFETPAVFFDDGFCAVRFDDEDTHFFVSVQRPDGIDLNLRRIGRQRNRLVRIKHRETRASIRPGDFDANGFVSLIGNTGLGLGKS